MVDKRENIIDRVTIKNDMYEAIEKISIKNNLTDIELIGILEELKYGVMTAATVQALEHREKVQ